MSALIKWVVLINWANTQVRPYSNRWPFAEAGSDKIAQVNQAVSFDASASSDPDGSIVSYSWDFGDGQSGSGLTAQHTYTNGTDCTVTLTVTDNDGATDTDTVFVEVNLPPVADTGTNDTYEDVGVDITFDANIARDPQNAPTIRHSFSVLDVTDPNIVHTAIADGQPADHAVLVSATAPSDAPTSYLTFSVIRNFSISEGDLVVSEIMANHASVSDGNGEWFEICLSKEKNSVVYKARQIG